VLDVPLPEEDLVPKTLAEQREAMLRRMKVMLRLSDDQLEGAKKIISASPILGQGNPDIVKYAITRAECRARREAAHVVEVEHPVCGAPYMVPLYDPRAGESESDARACIDEYEFPDMPCDYPVTWVSSREAAQLCEAIGKRICDAHEWEGGCAGALHAPEVEYAWGKPRKEMKIKHNAEREIVWAYGPEKDHSKCATDSKKSDTCEKSGWKKCGSNTYPSGSFPTCRSPLGVWDQHGNVAEHMNMPLKPKELASRGGSGETEMKGSWFIFKGFEAHEDDCRWRAPDWHATKLMSPDSHANYHLGFRCCKSVGGASDTDR
jgi:formylglycine-generating enzyme required for sulfatase activity